jgi:DNA-binding CsgD family transcriptional regulator
MTEESLTSLLPRERVRRRGRTTVDLHESSVVPHGDYARMYGMPLAPREREVLELIARGQVLNGIAALLGVSSNTVRRHKTVAFAKLGARSSAHAVALAIRSGQL